MTNILFGNVQIWTGDDACPYDVSGDLEVNR